MDNSKMNIRHFKLTNGEEIIALVQQKIEGSWILERPVSINSTMLGGYSFAPWFPFSNAKTFKVMKDHVLQHVPIAEKVQDTYVKYVLSQPPVVTPSHKSDEEILADYEQRLAEKYAEEGVPLDDKEDKIIH
tara:strand:- start:509 stop:904 length:396 start_codon:yes stop_codon:yes gene_type:complete